MNDAMTILARQLRLSVVTNVFEQGLLDEEATKELLAGPLTPGDDSTIYDDSALLGDCDGLEKIADSITESVADGGNSALLAEVKRLRAELEQTRSEVDSDIGYLELANEAEAETEQLRRELRDERVRRGEWEKMYNQAIAGTEVERLRAIIGEQRYYIAEATEAIAAERDELQAEVKRWRGIAEGRRTVMKKLGDRIRQLRGELRRLRASLEAILEEATSDLDRDIIVTECQSALLARSEE